MTKLSQLECRELGDGRERGSGGNQLSCRKAFTSTAHAFSKETHGHPLEQYRDCRNTDEQACQQDEKLADRRELPDEPTTHAQPSS